MQPAQVDLHHGIQVLVLPVGERSRDGQAELVSEEETVDFLNDFFEKIAAQGGEVIATFNKTVAQPPQHKGGFARPEERLFLVVKK